MKVFVKRLVGPPTAFVNLPDNARRMVALHEGGHALAALIYGVPVRLITVQPGKKSLGRVIMGEVNEYVGTQNDWMNQLRTCIGSMAAEKEAGLEATVGGSMDITMAMNIAQRLVDTLNYGSQTRLFNVAALSEARAGGMMETMAPSLGDHTVQRSDDEIRRLIYRAEAEVARTFANIGSESLWAIADVVNSRVTLTGAEFAEEVSRVLGTTDFMRFAG
jgi:ATP-dependent Zn protease